MRIWSNSPKNVYIPILYWTQNGRNISRRLSTSELIDVVHNILCVWQRRIGAYRKMTSSKRIAPFIGDIDCHNTTTTKSIILNLFEP